MTTKSKKVPRKKITEKERLELHLTPKLTENCQSTPERQAYEKLSFSSAAVINFSNDHLVKLRFLLLTA